MSYGCFFKVGSPKIPLVSCHFRIETAIKRWRVPCQTNHDSMPWLRHGLSYGQSVPSMQRVFVSLRLLLGRLKPMAFSSYSLYFCATMSMSNVLKIHCKVWHCPDGQPWDIHPSSWLISILNQPQRAWNSLESCHTVNLATLELKWLSLSAHTQFRRKYLPVNQVVVLVVELPRSMFFKRGCQCEFVWNLNFQTLMAFICWSDDQVISEQCLSQSTSH